MESPHPEWMETLGAEEGKEPAGVALLASQTDKKKLIYFRLLSVKACKCPLMYRQHKRV